MFDRIFASYLVQSQLLTEKNLDDIFSCQDKKRVRLGVIAMSEKLMTIDQVEEVNQEQAVCDKRFGDIAIEKGYLNQEQVSRLLFLQGNVFLAFMQAIIDNKLLTMAQMDQALDKYQKDNSFTLSNMEDLKSCDIDRIIPIFLYEQPALLQGLCGVMVRTVSRLVDYHVYIKKPYLSKEFPIHYFCMQELNGEHKMLTSLTASGDAMKQAAIGFAGKEYIFNEEDALDALCELINCVNGLYATELSIRHIEMDMDAPHYQQTDSVLKSQFPFLCLPMVIFQQEVNLIVSLNSSYTF